jgi:hypothetical protein
MQRLWLSTAACLKSLDNDVMFTDNNVNFSLAVGTCSAFFTLTLFGIGSSVSEQRRKNDERAEKTFRGRAAARLRSPLADTMPAATLHAHTLFDLTDVRHVLSCFVPRGGCKHPQGPMPADNLHLH